MEIAYLTLFISAFLAATILPLSSEIVIVSMILKGVNPEMSILTASLGNILGAALNYFLGLFGSTYLINRFLGTKKEEIKTACLRFEKYGKLSLILAWAPIIGDPLTIAAGILRVNFLIFLLLAGTGKILRYIFLTYTTLSLY